MCVNVINYVDVVSNSLLQLLDNIDVKLADDGNMYIDLNKNNQELLGFYIKSNIKDGIYFGRSNVIINTCRPFDNWRKKSRKNALKSCKYSISDESISIDRQKLEYFLDKTFNTIENNFTLTSISHNELDLFDMNIVLDKLLGINYNTKPSNYYILKDGNYEYSHDHNIPSYLISDIELILIDNEVII